MKKTIGIVLLLVSGVLAVYLMCFFGGAVRFETLCVDEERYHMITDSRRYASGEELLDELFLTNSSSFLTRPRIRFIIPWRSGAGRAESARGCAGGGNDAAASI